MRTSRILTAGAISVFGVLGMCNWGRERGEKAGHKTHCDQKSRPVLELRHKIDLYNGVNILAEDLSDSKEEFNIRMRDSLLNWRRQGLRGVWLRLPLNKVHLVDDAVKKHEFVIHSAQAHEVLLNKWLPEGKSSLPHAPSWFCGVGIICVKNGKILAVQEKNGTSYNILHTCDINA